ncbi:hypothetical protein H1C71_008125, partial [Ictidomys tridecemlineatus]
RVLHQRRLFWLFPGLVSPQVQAAVRSKGCLKGPSSRTPEAPRLFLGSYLQWYAYVCQALGRRRRRAPTASTGGSPWISFILRTCVPSSVWQTFSDFLLHALLS